MSFFSMRTTHGHLLFVIMVTYDCLPKSDLLNLLEVETSEPPSYFDVKLIYDAASVHFCHAQMHQLSLNIVNTFSMLISTKSYVTVI